MRKSLLVMIAVVLPAAAAVAEQARPQKSGKAPTPGKVLPLKRSSSANASFLVSINA